MFRVSEEYNAEVLYQTEIEVDCIRLETFCGTRGIAEIDLMWLDAQGSELNILKGLGEKIGRVKVVQCEVEFKEIYAGQPLWPEINEFMVEHGFQLHGIYDPNEWFGDAIFVNSNLV
jgi:hypothetical protein